MGIEEILNSGINLLKVENEHQHEIKKIISAENDKIREREIQKLSAELNYQLKEEELKCLSQRYKNLHEEQMLQKQNEHNENILKINSEYNTRNKKNEFEYMNEVEKIKLESDKNNMNHKENMSQIEKKN